MYKGIEIDIEGPRLPRKAVRLASFVLEERIGAPFSLRVTFTSSEGLDASVVVGSGVHLDFRVEGHDARRTHGVVESLRERVDLDTGYAVYEARISPALSLLRLTKTQEVYIDISLPDLVRKKLAGLGMKEGRDFEVRLSSAYPPREFIVQMDETDLALVHRLLEHDGISVFFEHRRSRSVAVFTDHARGFAKRPKSIHFDPRGEASGVRSLVCESQMIPSVVAVSDYNYENPNLDLLAVTNLESGLLGGIVEYGTNHMSPEEGRRLADVRGEAVLSTEQVFEGMATDCEIAPGHVIELVGHPRLSDVPMLVVSVEHHGGPRQYDMHHGCDAPALIAGEAMEGGLVSYSNVFKAILADRPFRPARTTPRPRVRGLLSGIVEPPPGVSVEQSSQAFIDPRGRYLVRMLFDSARPGERKASLPIRMIQSHAGPNYGIHFPLRPGAEVMIAFEHGDPDRPVIVGAVPNALTPTPVIRDNANLHRIRTWSGVQVEIDDGG